jgi:hypothetical protein
MPAKLYRISTYTNRKMQTIPAVSKSCTQRMPNTFRMNPFTSKIKLENHSPICTNPVGWTSLWTSWRPHLLTGTCSPQRPLVLRGCLVAVVAEGKSRSLGWRCPGYWGPEAGTEHTEAVRCGVVRTRRSRLLCCRMLEGIPTDDLRWTKEARRWVPTQSPSPWLTYYYYYSTLHYLNRVGLLRVLMTFFTTDGFQQTQEMYYKTWGFFWIRYFPE